ncbi:UNVERIFIED_CONTAM: hypothetical protein RMT77_008620 [Armadillidium vulgare]
MKIGLLLLLLSLYFILYFNSSYQFSSEWGGIRNDFDDQFQYAERFKELSNKSTLFNPLHAVVETLKDELLYKNAENKYTEIEMKVLKVAFFLRFNKFYLEVPRSKSFDSRQPWRIQKLHQRFPEKRFKMNSSLAIFCKKSFISCLYEIDRVINRSIINLQFDAPTLKLVGKKFCSNTDDGKFFCVKKEKVNHKLSLTSYCEDKYLEEGLVWPDADKYRFVVTAMYFMCWYTFHHIPYLANLVQCDSRYNCEHPLEQDGDLRAMHDHPFSCALHSFCPDPCCRLPFKRDKSTCESLPSNPCRMNSNANQRKCSIDVNNNKDFNRLRRNEMNITCVCQHRGEKYNVISRDCIDRDECLENPNICDSKTENCFNTRRGYKCVCKWGYYYNSTKQKCLRDINVDERRLHHKAKLRYNPSKEHWKREAGKESISKKSFSTSERIFQNIISLFRNIANAFSIMGDVLKKLVKFLNIILTEVVILIESFANIFGIELKSEEEKKFLEKKDFDELVLMKINIEDLENFTMKTNQ